MADPKKEPDPPAHAAGAPGAVDDLDAATAAAAAAAMAALAEDDKPVAAAGVGAGAAASASPKAAAAAAATAAAKPAAAAPAAPPTSWSCAVCTLVNGDVYATKCSACGSVNPMPVKRPGPASSASSRAGGGGGGGGGDKWSCATCTYLNGAPATVCWSCQTPRYPKSKPAAAAAAAKPAPRKENNDDGDDIDPALAAAMAGLAGVDGAGAVGADLGGGGGGGGALPVNVGGGGAGGLAGLGGMAAMFGAMNGGGGMGGGRFGGGVDVGPNNAGADMITQIAKQFGRLPLYILKGEKLIEEFRGMVYWLSIVELFLFLLGVACFCSFLDSDLMKWVWLYSGHAVRPLLGLALVSKLPHVAQVVEIVLSADRLEEGLALVPQQLQPLLLPIAGRLILWIVFAILSFVPDMVGLIFRLIDFQLSNSDLANGEQLPWIVLFALGVVFVLCDLYFFLWLGLVWNSVPPYLQLQARNLVRQALGRPPLPDQPLLPANANANANANNGGGNGARAYAQTLAMFGAQPQPTSYGTVGPTFNSVMRSLHYQPPQQQPQFQNGAGAAGGLAPVQLGGLPTYQQQHPQVYAQPQQPQPQVYAQQQPYAQPHANAQHPQVYAQPQPLHPQVYAQPNVLAKQQQQYLQHATAQAQKATLQVLGVTTDPYTKIVEKRFLDGRVIWFDDLWRDIRYLFRQEHPLFGVCLSSHKHPFSRGERIVNLILSLCVSFFAATIAELQDNSYTTSVALSAIVFVIVQINRLLAECGCTQWKCLEHNPGGKVACEMCGKCAAFYGCCCGFQFLIAGLMVLFLVTYTREHFSGASFMLSFAISQATSWFGLDPAAIVAKGCFKTWREHRDDEAKADFAEYQRLYKERSAALHASDDGCCCCVFVLPDPSRGAEGGRSVAPNGGAQGHGGAPLMTTQPPMSQPQQPLALTQPVLTQQSGAPAAIGTGDVQVVVQQPGVASPTATASDSAASLLPAGAAAPETPSTASSQPPQTPQSPVSPAPVADPVPAPAPAAVDPAPALASVPEAAAPAPTAPAAAVDDAAAPVAVVPPAAAVESPAVSPADTPAVEAAPVPAVSGDAPAAASEPQPQPQPEPQPEPSGDPGTTATRVTPEPQTNPKASPGGRGGFTDLHDRGGAGDTKGDDRDLEAGDGGGGGGGADDDAAAEEAENEAEREKAERTKARSPNEMLRYACAVGDVDALRTAMRAGADPNLNDIDLRARSASEAKQRVAAHLQLDDGTQPSGGGAAATGGSPGVAGASPPVPHRAFGANGAGAETKSPAADAKWSRERQSKSKADKHADKDKDKDKDKEKAKAKKKEKEKDGDSGDSDKSDDIYKAVVLTGDYPLHIAVENAHPECVTALVNTYGARLESRNRLGSTPLHRATSLNRADLVTLLLSLGSSVIAPNAIGNRPLHIAAYGGFIEVAQVLLRAGAWADVHSKNKVALTPIDYAKKSSLQQLLQRYRPGQEGGATAGTFDDPAASAALGVTGANGAISPSPMSMSMSLAARSATTDRKDGHNARDSGEATAPLAVAAANAAATAAGGSGRSRAGGARSGIVPAGAPSGGVGFGLGVITESRHSHAQATTTDSGSNGVAPTAIAIDGTGASAPLTMFGTTATPVPASASPAADTTASASAFTASPSAPAASTTSTLNNPRESGSGSAGVSPSASPAPSSGPQPAVSGGGGGGIRLAGLGNIGKQGSALGLQSNGTLLVGAGAPAVSNGLHIHTASPATSSSNNDSVCVRVTADDQHQTGGGSSHTNATNNTLAQPRHGHKRGASSSGGGGSSGDHHALIAPSGDKQHPALTLTLTAPATPSPLSGSLPPKAMPPGLTPTLTPSASTNGLGGSGSATASAGNSERASVEREREREQMQQLQIQAAATALARERARKLSTGANSSDDDDDTAAHAPSDGRTAPIHAHPIAPGAQAPVPSH